MNVKEDTRTLAELSPDPRVRAQLHYAFVHRFLPGHVRLVKQHTPTARIDISIAPQQTNPDSTMNTHAETCREKAAKPQTCLPAAVVLVANALLAGACVSLAQSSATSVSFQGALKGSNGQPLPDGNYTMTFQFWDHRTSTAENNQPLCQATSWKSVCRLPRRRRIQGRRGTGERRLACHRNATCLPRTARVFSYSST